MKNKVWKKTRWSIYPPKVIPGLDYAEELFLDMNGVLDRLPKFRESDIKYFISRGVIGKFPITCLDFEVLKRIHNVWGTESLVLINSKKLSKRARRKILDKTSMGIGTRLESWVYTRILSFKKSGKKVPRKQILRETLTQFKLKDSRKEREKIKNLIERILKKLYREKNDKT
ncbi:MAG TPA: hypothetical protein PKV92_08865 [Thermodesulfovibrio thiophilus]|nr:hypothetical protein [Thermodesulfovibrio thiophilus]